MTITVQAETDTATRISRRQVLAAIALADAPTPNEITFRDDDTKLSIDLDRLTDLRPWAKVLGASPQHIKSALSKDRLLHYKTAAGVQMVSAYLCIDWQGWKVSLDANEREGAHVDPLDDATRKQLRAVADEPATAEAGTSR